MAAMGGKPTLGVPFSLPPEGFKKLVMECGSLL